MEKYETFHTRIGKGFFERNISSISHFNELAQRKRKMYDANDLLALSLVRIIVCIYFLGKKFYCTYFKTAALDNIVLCLMHKTFYEKRREKLVKV